MTSVTLMGCLRRGRTADTAKARRDGPVLARELAQPLEMKKATMTVEQNLHARIESSSRS